MADIKPDIVERTEPEPDRDTVDVDAGPATRRGADLQSTSRTPFQLGLGVILAFVAAILALASFVFIWFGVFPGLVALLLCIPIALTATRLIRRGRPAGTT